jgi:hypothetical protein
MKGKTMLSALMLFVVAIFAMASVSALEDGDVVASVEFDGVELYDDSTTSVRNFERGQEVDVEVVFVIDDAVDANGDGVEDNSNDVYEDVELEVELTGYDGDRITDSVYLDDVKEGETYVKRLSLDFPWDMDQDSYTLRVTFSPRFGDALEASYTLDVEAQEDAFVIKDVDFAPGLTVEAGDALLATVRVQNVGDETDDDGVKVKVSIPELGVSATDYIDEVDMDDSTSSEELYLRVPSTASAGDYEVDVTVYFDDGDESVSESYTLTVTAAEAAQEDNAVESKTVITVGPEEQDLTAGQGGAVYPVTLSNAAGEAKTYVVSVSGYESWGDVRVDPSTVVVLNEGETQTVYLFVSADEDASGSYTFGVTVSAGSETLKEVLLTANVEAATSAPAEESAGSWDSVKKGLEVGLIVLVILLVVLGLVLVVNKLRSEDDDEESKTYY